MRRAFIWTFILIVVIFLFYAESRKFYCTTEGKCITVWKTFVNTCFIIPEKYYGVLPPSSSSYVKTVNTNNISVIWPSMNNNLIFNATDSSFTIRNFPNSINIINYIDQKNYYDSIFLIKDGHYSKFKEEVDFISVDIKENYSISEKR